MSPFKIVKIGSRREKGYSVGENVTILSTNPEIRARRVCLKSTEYGARVLEGGAVFSDVANGMIVGPRKFNIDGVGVRTYETIGFRVRRFLRKGK